MAVSSIVILVLTALVGLATVVSFIHVPHGAVRVFSFPRLQICVLAVVLLVAVLFAFPDGPLDSILVVVLISSIVAQGFAIVQFTPLRRKQSANWEGDPNGPETVSILSFNVKESNRDFAKALATTRDCDPDIALFMETDQRWVEALEPLRENYPHVVSHPLANAYGMILFSRLELVDPEVKYLVMDEIPSIIATVKLKDGRPFRLYCVHPEPPVPAVDSLGRDAELVVVARLVEKDRMPCLVIGDLNDVAWSATTRMFQRLSRLLDPRVGRGFYNTFDARYPFMRWPLDHLFHDRRFQLVEMARLHFAGSDHFPMYFKLALGKYEEGEVEMPDEADRDDRQEAREIEEGGRKLQRDPIGTDWES
ncbi:endonuclease/exonuclease/phosphatase family protein [Aureimonas mangrovi]|uniref:endonuclease/exonuclease/phosphatase family protein n=1 Tax=Aureimonas mangrovi TaxID=2758041 RepID=UPI00163D5060|nr:endonuclease/exonuclease/phosphatase family protein [Aureimonas mangrovi]